MSYTRYLANPEQDWKPYALQILAGVLDGNESARLNKRLVREQQIASGQGGLRCHVARPSLFPRGHAQRGKTVADVEAALRGKLHNWSRAV